jgi:hypothetical protein
MKRIVLINLLLFFAFLTVSCTPPDDLTIRSIFITPGSNATIISTPTDTQVPVFTSIPTSLASDTPLPSETPTAIPSPTPTPDLRVITESADKFLLQDEDLPRAGKYYLAGADWINRHSNTEIISSWGSEEGSEYIENTGRIDGWSVYYSRGTSNVIAPEEIFHNITQYQTFEGAQLTVSDYNYIARGEAEWELIKEEVDIGDMSIAMTFKEMQSNGKFKVHIYIKTAYRNYVSNVAGSGAEDEVTLDYMISIARIVLDKLETAPLSEPPGG